MRRLSKASRWAALVLVPVALSLSACGGESDSADSAESDDGPVTSKEVVVAFEDASGGHEFEKKTSLVDGAVAYGPHIDPDPEAVEVLNEKLGEGSVLWQVVVFDGPEPPLDEAAAKKVAFASNTFEPAGDGVFIGDYDTAYFADGNVVVTGPALDGDPDDETLKRWKAVLEGL